MNVFAVSKQIEDGVECLPFPATLDLESVGPGFLVFAFTRGSSFLGADISAPSLILVVPAVELGFPSGLGIDQFGLGPEFALLFLFEPVTLPTCSVRLYRLLRV